MITMVIYLFKLVIFHVTTLNYQKIECIEIWNWNKRMHTKKHKNVGLRLLLLELEFYCFFGGRFDIYIFTTNTYVYIHISHVQYWHIYIYWISMGGLKFVEDHKITSCVCHFGWYGGGLFNRAGDCETALFVSCQPAFEMHVTQCLLLILCPKFGPNGATTSPHSHICNIYSHIDMTWVSHTETYGLQI